MVIILIAIVIVGIIIVIIIIIIMITIIFIVINIVIIVIIIIYATSFTPSIEGANNRTVLSFKAWFSVTELSISGFAMWIMPIYPGA